MMRNGITRMISLVALSLAMIISMLLVQGGFKYDDQRFNVAVVKQEGFNSCTVGEGDKVFDSGDDTIQLNFGTTYFIDSESDVCAAGMKMAIQATAPPN
ncbi:Plastocyanin-like protein [Corchorus olitorius]|uniref:Plastocyanin-like protein n=1 Tax=Corchorus olitorius TaxID=93759 RepID=A0A1R3JZF4_9ROSI|nr:Plastocyanin-like protein [Corchorus olitorius]